MARSKRRIHENLFLLDWCWWRLGFSHFNDRDREEEACMEQALKSVRVDEEHKLCRFRVLYKFPILSLKKRGSRGIKKKRRKMCDAGIRFCEILPSFLLCCVYAVSTVALAAKAHRINQKFKLPHNRILSLSSINLFPPSVWVLPFLRRKNRLYLHFQ